MHKETSHIENRETKVIDKNEYFCDLCNKEITREDSSIDTYNFKLKTGYGYSDGGHIYTEQAYFCLECATKIKNMLIAIGTKFEKTEYDF